MERHVVAKKSTAGLGMCTKCGVTCELVYNKDVQHTDVNECNAKAPAGWRFLRSGKDPNEFWLHCGPCSETRS